jgi:hypothetical protein
VRYRAFRRASTQKGVSMSEQAQINEVDDDLKDIGFVCRYFGGKDTPLHPSTVYRKIKEGIISRPEDLGGRMSRWRESKLRKDRQRMFDRADKAQEVA